MALPKSVLLVNIFLLIVVSSSFCELFTAQVELESLSNLRQSVSDSIRRYLEKEELRLKEIRDKFLLSSGLSKISCLEKTSKSSNGDDSSQTSSSSLMNPINSFLTIKGLSKDLVGILLPALDKSNIQELHSRISQLNEEYSFPNENDIKGAAIAMIRLQNTYKLNASTVAKGCLVANHCSTKLSVGDCFELGRQSYQARNYDHAIEWMKEALNRLEEEEAQHNFNVTQSSSYTSHFTLRNSDEAPEGTLISHHQRVVSPRSDVSRAEILEYLTWAEDILSTVEMGKRFVNDLTGIELEALVEGIARAAERHATGNKESHAETFKKYEALCRGENRDSISQNPKLKCSYTTRNDWYLLIGPFKQEEVSLDPLIVLFHDVIHDDEIRTIQNLAIPDFETAKVINVATGQQQLSFARVSKSAWLIDSQDSVVQDVNKRVGMITSLDMETAEDLQIANYGIGGMYEPHFDFAHTAESASFLSDGSGNRIATLMFYLSDVEVGGATVFPVLNLSIWPTKGSAVFWYNLKADGSGDFRTKHAACPVLIGSKWVANKWIHERGQEWRRPCELHKQTEDIKTLAR